ncbi:MAG: hypothetical protein J0L62_03060 [Bacteroidetes bacterium]|nr:hypothetical protein [Bacteroidota bacterium]
MKIPPFFWIGAPNRKPLSAGHDAGRSIHQNVLSFAFSSIEYQLKRDNYGKTIHQGSFLASLESTELILKMKGKDHLFDFYHSAYTHFIAQLSEHHLSFIQTFFESTIRSGLEKQKVKILIDSQLMGNFIHFKGKKADWFEVYFAWLVTILIQYLTSKEVFGLDSPYEDADNTRLLNYERERALQLMMCRVKVSSQTYQLVNDFRLSQTGSVYL